MKTISLFSSYGLGDLGLRAAGADIVLMAELLERRCRHLERNFPEAEVVPGDLEEGWGAVADRAEKILAGEAPYLLVATPPCQGMSTNGAGKLARAVERGDRPKLDPRNRLIIPALKIIKRLSPRWVVFENVVQMKNTVIVTTTTTTTTTQSPDEDEEITAPIVDIIREELEGLGYSGGHDRVDFGRHGVPQNRQRLITVFGLDGPHDIKSLLPPKTGKPITLRQAIGHFKKLDAYGKTCDKDDSLHRVKRMNPRHYWWVSCIPGSSGGTAYDNQCDCGWETKTKPGKQGKKEKCPAYCGGCGELLPRPTVPQKGGKRRIISGFRSAYKRMEWDRPAPTVTMNLMTPSSDNKLHPDQNRTLSPAEAAVLQTVSGYPGGGHPGYEYDWMGASDGELCDALGEAVPPLFFERLLRHLAGMPTWTERRSSLE